MTGAWLAAVLAVLATAVWVPPRTRWRAAVFVLGDATDPQPLRRSRSGLLEVATLGSGLLALGLVAPVGPLVLAAAAVAGLVVVRLRAAARADRDSAARQQAVVDACEALVGELRAGQPLAPALEGAARVWPELSPAAVRARLGGDVPQALREVGDRPGAEVLRRVAGAWTLCATSGTGLVHALDRVLETVRGDQEARRQVRTELAATRATARMVSGLPLLLIVGAQGAGARPWHVLMATLPGQVCLLGGVALVGAGLLWIERIARSAVEDP